MSIHFTPICLYLLIICPVPLYLSINHLFTHPIHSIPICVYPSVLYLYMFSVFPFTLYLSLSSFIYGKPGLTNAGFHKNCFSTEYTVKLNIKNQ